jgi:hypothetical protein
LKLKHCTKYIVFTIIISCAGLFSFRLTNNENYKNEDKPSRIIIKSAEEKITFNGKETTNIEGVRVSVPVTNATPQVQHLPLPDTNSSIIVSTLQ